jgi:dolichol-phosphate mannosyltransferase
VSTRRARSSGVVGEPHGSARVAAPKPNQETPLVSVVVPTRDEEGNVPVLVKRLEGVLPARLVEIVFVDDSQDSTPEGIEAARASSRVDIRLIHRIENRRWGGLGGAVVEGLRSARGQWVCVMDGDLQHPPELLRRLLREAQAGDHDLVVASRYCSGGSAGEVSRARSAVSRTLTLVTRLAFPFRLAGVSDPLSGFFLVRRDALQLDALRPHGFKILLEIAARTRPRLRAAEVPFSFGARHAGESKASVREGLIYIVQLFRLRMAAPADAILAIRPRRDLDGLHEGT